MLNNSSVKNECSRVSLFLLLFHTIIGLSAFFHHFSIPNSVKFIISVFGLFYYIFILKRKFKLWQIGLILILLGTTFIKVVYFSNIVYLQSSFLLITAVLYVGFSTKTEVEKFVDYSSIIITITLVGALFGFLLAQVGVSPLIDYINPDGRKSYLFYTTLTNSYYGNFIRPSGIYDEPGTLAFLTACVLYLRLLFKKNEKLSLLILTLGFITFSLAFAIFALLYFLSMNFSANKIAYLVTILFATTIIITTLGSDSLLNKYLIGRLVSSDSEKSIIGGTRHNLMNNTFSNIQAIKGAFFWGVSESCTYDRIKCENDFGYMGENPLTPLAYHGIFMAWPYYIFLIFLGAFIATMPNKVAHFALMLLFIQRPYVLHYGYSFFAIIAVIINLESINKIWNEKKFNLSKVMHNTFN